MVDDLTEVQRVA